MSEPLTDEERESFRAYAEENHTEPDGTESQWAAYTLRLLDEVAALRAKVEELTLERNRLAHGALYREAVEALGRAHGLLDCRKYRMAEPSACTPDNLCPECLVAADADAVLAKAREVLNG